MLPETAFTLQRILVCESTRQIIIDAWVHSDSQTDTQTEPLCAVVLTTEREQHPGLRVWMGNERHEKGCTGKQKKTCKPHQILPALTGTSTVQNEAL